MSSSPAFALATPLQTRLSSVPLSRSVSRTTPPFRCATKMQPPRATIAVPSDPTQTTPGSEEGTASAPWMPLPGLVHEIVTPDEFDRLLDVATQEKALLVVDFMASWCRKCLYLLPRLKKMGREDFEQVYYCSVDVNKVKRLPKQFEIAKMPTFVYLKNGERVDTVIGAAAPPKVVEAIRAKIEKYATS